ncbi:hypothetical protein BGX34_008252 [Mortierella sp. NVP85]|nr:hypothetical protein BGX34_008252 [Mortierella sp. NVP85]
MCRRLQPQLAIESSSAFVEGQGLYILSGYTTDVRLTDQTIMLDLSVSWSTTGPKYKTLPTGPISNWFASALTADGQKWFALADGTGQVLDLHSNNDWSELFTYSGASTPGLGAATDPETGKIYIPFGYLMENGLRSMMIVDLKNNSYSTDNVNIPLFITNKYAITWNTQLKGLLYANPAGIFKYTPSTGWISFHSPPRLSASDGYCMVSSGSGSKVVLFGGSIKGQNFTTGEIFILDVKTLIWRKGISTAPENTRRSCACAISNDYFIAWGGQGRADSQIIAPKKLTVVYDLKADKWVSYYIAPTTTPTTTITATPNPSDSDAPTSTSTPSGSSSITGVIAGAICGGLAIGLFAGGIYEYRARKNRIKSSTSSSDNSVYMDTYANSSSDREDGMGNPNRRMETAQVGAFGSREEPQDPHVLISTNHYGDRYTTAGR